MAQYHVACSPISGTIYAGTINKKGNMWVNKSDVTEEALAAVRDCLEVKAMEDEKQSFGYEWKKKDGTTVELAIKIIPPMENEHGAEAEQKKNRKHNSLHDAETDGGK